MACIFHGIVAKVKFGACQLCQYCDGACPEEVDHTPRSEFMPHPFLAAQINSLSQQNSTLPMAHDTAFCENCDQPPLGHALTLTVKVYDSVHRGIFWFVQAREHASIASSRNLLEQISSTSSALHDAHSHWCYYHTHQHCLQ